MIYYILGLLTPIAFAVLALLLPALARVLLKLVEFSMAHLGKDTPDEQRAAVTAVVFGARRARIVAWGGVALALVWGQDHDRRMEAYQKLQPVVRANGPSVRVLGKDEPEEKTE